MLIVPCDCTHSTHQRCHRLKRMESTCLRCAEMPIISMAIDLTTFHLASDASHPALLGCSWTWCGDGGLYCRVKSTNCSLHLKQVATNSTIRGDKRHHKLCFFLTARWANSLKLCLKNGIQCKRIRRHISALIHLLWDWDEPSTFTEYLWGSLNMYSAYAMVCGAQSMDNSVFLTSTNRMPNKVPIHLPRRDGRSVQFGRHPTPERFRNAGKSWSLLRLHSTSPWKCINDQQITRCI